jgi:hypothetical protein
LEVLIVTALRQPLADGFIFRGKKFWHKAGFVREHPLIWDLASWTQMLRSHFGIWVLWRVFEKFDGVIFVDSGYFSKLY